MQVLDNDGHPDGKITKHETGDLYDLIKSNSEPVKPVRTMEHRRGDQQRRETRIEIKRGDYCLHYFMGRCLENPGLKKVNLPSGLTSELSNRARLPFRITEINVWYRNIMIKEL